MDKDNKVKFEGLNAKIESAYYLKDKDGKRYEFKNSEQAYIFLKDYVNSIKAEDDIIICNDTRRTIIINTANRTLPLDRYVWINPSNVNIDDLDSNVKR